MVGRCVFPNYGKCKSIDDIDGAIFNMDGSTYKPQFDIDTGKDPMALATGNDRFFIAYDSYASLLDWDGNIIWQGFTTISGYFPINVIHHNDKFYLLLSPKHGNAGVVMQVYDLDANVEDIWNIEEIPRIDYLEYGVYSMGTTRFPEGDMALGGDKFFIVWYDKSTRSVYGVIYNTSGAEVKRKFLIRDGITESCKMHNGNYVKPNVAAGERNFLVAVPGFGANPFGTGSMFLYDISTGDFVGEKLSALNCVHDLTYGDGKFLITENQQAYFYDEDGNPAGQGLFGGHGDQMTTLAYGNKMFVGVVAVHMAGGDGIGISFLNSQGTHILDVLAILFAESPGLASYDW
jgi:hypothetical protein